MRLRLFLVFAGAALLAFPGWAGEGAVALQTADTSCRTTKTPPPRYVDCGNGTVTDNKTGLVWLKKADCLGGVDWHEAVEFVAGLGDWPDSVGSDCGLSDGSSPGEWRLPSVWEWEAMIQEALSMLCDPLITNDQGDGCWAAPFACVAVGRTCSFTGVQSQFYWGSFSPSHDLRCVFGMHLREGGTICEFKTTDARVWPVRSGQ